MTRAKKGDKTRRRPKKMRKKKPFHPEPRGPRALPVDE
jgi:hypothetical protein